MLHTYQPSCKDPLGVFELETEAKYRSMMALDIKNEIERQDELIFNEALRICPKCGAVMHSHGRTREITYLTSCGEVTLRLHRLRCINCGYIEVPSKRLIPTDRVSAVLAERICDLASKMPYQKAADSLLIQHNIFISATSFWKYVQNEAFLIDDVIEEETKLLYTTGKAPDNCLDLNQQGPLIIGIDGGWVHGWRKQPSFEVKCATIATGSSPGPGKEHHLLNRVGYAAQCSVEEFRKRISLLAIKQGYNTASVCIFVSDGAYWISKMISDYFPEAIHVLDMYHLKNKIFTYFGINAVGEDLELRDSAIDACNNFSPKEILSALYCHSPSDVSKADKLRDLISYIINNFASIENHKSVRIHGSGWIEKGVDLMISRRLKNRGMGWTLSGSANMIPFAVMRYNKDWDKYWSIRKGLSLT